MAEVIEIGMRRDFPSKDLREMHRLRTRVFKMRMGIDRYVTVTTTIERLLRRTGIAISRYGPPIRIGVENAVALNIDIGEQTRRALFGNLAQAA